MGDSDYSNAKKRVEIKISFFIHLTVYILVNILLVIINLSRNPEVIWFKWPLMGWGIGLVIHGIFTFASLNLNNIKERMIEKEINKQGKRR